MIFQCGDIVLCPKLFGDKKLSLLGLYGLDSVRIRDEGDGIFYDLSPSGKSIEIKGPDNPSFLKLIERPVLEINKKDLNWMLTAELKKGCVDGKIEFDKLSSLLDVFFKQHEIKLEMSKI